MFLLIGISIRSPDEDKARVSSNVINSLYCDINIYDDKALGKLILVCLKALELSGKPISDYINQINPQC